MLSWIDICAGLAAKSVAGGPCVTASVDAVHFLRPVRVGSVAIVAAMVNRTFNSSMEARGGYRRRFPLPAVYSGPSNRANRQSASQFVAVNSAMMKLTFPAVSMHAARHSKACAQPTSNCSCSPVTARWVTGMMQCPGDRAACATVHQHGRHSVVWLRMGVHFWPCLIEQPTSTALLKRAAVSVQVGVRVEEENMGTGARAHCCSAYLTFVAVSADGSGAPSTEILLPSSSELPLSSIQIDAQDSGDDVCSAAEHRVCIETVISNNRRYA